MMIAEVRPPSDLKISGVISLPASKSISNRALIIRAIGNLSSEIYNLSDAGDTVTLHKILDNLTTEIDAGEGGTTLRFLLAMLSVKPGEFVIDAAPSLASRPVSELVEALRFLGAPITYLKEEGKLPLRITGGMLTGNKVQIRGDISSQFISALMMIGPVIRGGLTITVTGEVLSLPYIHMTRSVMEHYGARVDFDGSVITVHEGNYIPSDLVIEPDWSAASFWYECAALASECELLLMGLKEKSLQGDSVIAVLMKQLGVETEFTSDGALVRSSKNRKVTDYFFMDFSACPDLGPPVAAACGGLNMTADLAGLKNFRLKESDRAVAMQRELYNMRVKTDFCGGSKFKVYSGSGMKLWPRLVQTYRDHRIAMAFAPLSLKTGCVLISEPEVVKKSYPKFWDDLRTAGFQVQFKDS